MIAQTIEFIKYNITTISWNSIHILVVSSVVLVLTPSLFWWSSLQTGKHEVVTVASVLQKERGAEVFTGQHGGSLPRRGRDHWWGVRKRSLNRHFSFWESPVIVIVISQNFVFLLALFCWMMNSHSVWLQPSPDWLFIFCCQGDFGKWFPTGLTEGQLQGRKAISHCNLQSYSFQCFSLLGDQMEQEAH